ncbi:MAG: hypothetical protein IKY71_01830 [Bacteroidaceae bacterium]|nr:hypothetical protein [Bacteroidaceae bacterium]
MEKKEYTKPAALEIEVSGCNMICASILIDNNEVNTGGRSSRNRRNGWDNGFWVNER